MLTASGRLARQLTQAWNAEQLAAGRSAWPSPDILPWNAWLRRAWDSSLSLDEGAVLLGSSRELALWERVIAESPGADLLLHLPATAGAAADAWKLLHAWQLPLEGAEWDGSEETRAFKNWAESFREICRERRWLDEARLPDLLRARLAGGWPASRRLELAGFDEFTPQQSALLDALRAAGTEIVERPHPAARAAARVAVCEDSSGEIAAAARWARGLLEEGARGPIGIVTPELPALRSRVERIFREVLEPGALTGIAGRAHPAFHLSAGPALADYPAIRAAFLVLELGRGHLSLAETGSLLRSPFLAGADREMTSRATLDAGLRRRRDLQVSLPSLAAAGASCPVLTQGLDAFREQWRETPRRGRPSEWARHFSALLRALGWPGERSMSSGEFQTIEAWRELLSEFASLDLCLPGLEFSPALARLRRMAAGAMFQPEAGDAPVQVLGVLEAAGLRFEHLWVMGLDDETWPAPARPNPFLPRAWQRERGLPHASAEREFSYSFRALARLVASADSAVILSFPKRDGERDPRPSPFLNGVPLLEEGELRVSPSPVFLEAVRQTGGLEDRPSEAPVPLPDSTDVPGGAVIFKLQAACPFRAFATLRLGAEPLEEGEFGLAPDERGRLLHAALERLWSELGSHENLCAWSAERLQALIQDAVAGAVQECRPLRRGGSNSRYASIEQRRLEKLLGEWLEIERQRGPFTVVKQEGARQVEWGGLVFRIRVDRIDQLAGGRQAILDYKSGEHAVAEWDGERPDEPQLPLYALTHSQEPAAVLFAQLKTGGLRFKGYAREEVVAAGVTTLDERSWNERMLEWRAALTRLAEDFRAGRAEVDPKDPRQTCRLCSLTPLCRVTELGLAGAAPETEENGHE